jgi:hypothetical protein
VQAVVAALVLLAVITRQAALAGQVVLVQPHQFLAVASHMLVVAEAVVTRLVAELVVLVVVEQAA